MERLKKISKVMNVVLKLVLLYVAIQFILSLVNLGSNQIAQLMEVQGADTFKVSHIDIGVFELDFRNEQSLATKLLIKSTVLDLLAVTLNFSAIAFLICTLGKLLKPMTQGQPFNGSVSRTLKRLGAGCILIGILANVISYLQFRITHSAFFELAVECLSGEIKGISSHFNIQVGYLFIGVMILMLSLVFRYGEELQVQVDETL